MNTCVFEAFSGFTNELQLIGKTGAMIGAIKLQKLFHKIAIFLQKMCWMEF
jgi:hypothetical protein